jgi:hypothetical protein
VQFFTRGCGSVSVWMGATGVTASEILLKPRIRPIVIPNNKPSQHAEEKPAEAARTRKHETCSQSIAIHASSST